MRSLCYAWPFVTSVALLCSACGVEETPPPMASPPMNCDGAAFLATAPRTARHAKSMGFSGTPEAYTALYEVACAAVANCSQACIASGGTKEMCDASECLPIGVTGMACLPPPVWSNLQGIQAESTLTDDAVQIVAVDTLYRDRLLVFQFGLAVPADAVVRGIQLSIRHSGDESIVDDSVKLSKAGRAVGADRAAAQSWSSEALTWVDYGNPDDLWGEAWTPADLNGDGFGVVQSVLYGKTVGNSRAYVDQVRVTVHYSLSVECR